MLLSDSPHRGELKRESPAASGCHRGSRCSKSVPQARWTASPSRMSAGTQRAAGRTAMAVASGVVAPRATSCRPASIGSDHSDEGTRTTRSNVVNSRSKTCVHYASYRIDD